MTELHVERATFEEALVFCPYEAGMNRKFMENQAIFKIEHEGEIIVMGGTVALNPTTVELWTVFSEKSKGFIGILKAAREFVRGALEYASQIVAVVEPENTIALRFVEKMNMKRKGTIENVHGRDWYFYSIEREPWAA